MTMVAVVTTTINVPHRVAAFRDAAKLCTDLDGHEIELRTYVVGDDQTPAEARRFVATIDDAVYLDDVADAQRPWQSYDAIPRRCVQRRNLGVLEAIADGVDYVLLVDDDQVPAEPTSYFTTLLRGFTRLPHAWWSPTEWWNPGTLLHPATVHRGFPIALRQRSHQLEIATSEGAPNVHVVAGLTVGDPDVDAVERVVKQPYVKAMDRRQVALRRGTWAPFNSQNTAYTWDAAPLAMCIPGVGRFDDIWASYVARAVLDSLDWSVAHGMPATHSDRNRHDVVDDLAAELDGYRWTPQVADALRAVSFEPAADVVSRLRVAHAALFDRDLLPAPVRYVCQTWYHDVRAAIAQGQEARRVT